MKLNFLKFLNRDKDVPAAKFKGQSYGIGRSEFYDEDENEDVRMVKPMGRNELGADSDDSDMDFDIDMDDSDDSDMDAEDNMPQLDDRTADILTDLIKHLSCDGHACDSIKDWIETSGHFNDEDVDFLLNVVDEQGDDFDTDDSEDFDSEDFDMDDSEDFDMDDSDDDDESLSDKLTALKHRYDEESVKKKF